MIKAIIFDKDGTLLDLGDVWDKPTDLVTDLLLDRSDLNHTEREIFKRQLGIVNGQIRANSIFSMGSNYEAAQEFAKILPMSAEEIESIMEDFLHKHIQSAEQPPKVVNGALELVKDLQDHFILGIVTNDNHRLAQAMLDRSELSQYFSFLGCADDFGPKPNPAALYEISRRFDIALDEMIYIGDSIVDMEYGKHTLASIGYAADDSHREMLNEADYIIEEFNELPPIINLLNQRKDILDES